MESSVVFIGAKAQNAVSWHAGKQELICLSTCESELVGATSGMSRSIRISLLLEEITGIPTVRCLGVDNMPSIQQLKAGLHAPWRTRHISIRGARLAEMIGRGEIQLEDTPTDGQPTNGLTKALAGQSIEHARRQLGMVQF